MYVKDKEFYHIHRVNRHSPFWMPGNQIDITNKQPNEFNAFYSRFSRTFVVNERTLFPNQLTQELMSIRSYLTIDQLWEAIVFYKDVVADYAIYLREQVFEEVRLQYFSNLPSRRTGIWVFAQESEQYWCSTLNNIGAHSFLGIANYSN